MIELIATVVDHRHVKPDSAWAVATVEVTEARMLADDGTPAPTTEQVPAAARAGQHLAAVGDRLGLAALGEPLRLRGELEGSKFGQQLRVREQEALTVSTVAQASKWLERLKGVGRELAARLTAHFGEGLTQVLATPPAGPFEPDPHEQVKGVGPTVASWIRESYAELGKSGSLEDVQYLDGLGLTPYEVTAVIGLARAKGMKPKELLTTAPYSLTEARGFGFPRADTVARKAGTPRRAPARVEAALVHMSAECAKDGSTMVKLGELLERTAELAEVESPLVLDAFRRALAAKRVVTSQETKPDGTKGPRWVHSRDLYEAEEGIYRFLVDLEGDVAGDVSQLPLAIPTPEQVAVVGEKAGAAIARQEEGSWS